MTLSIQIAKFRFYQYQIRAISSNLKLAKVTRYTVGLAQTLTTDLGQHADCCSTLPYHGKNENDHNRYI